MFERSLNILFLFASTPLFFTAELFPLLEEHLLYTLTCLVYDSSLNFLPQISQGFSSVHIFLTFKILIVIIELINFNFQIPLVVLHCQALRFIWKIYLFESQLPPFRSSQHKKIFFLTHQHFLAIFFLCLHDGIFLEMFFFYSYSVFLFFLLSCLERRGIVFFIADLLEIFLTFWKSNTCWHRNSFIWGGPSPTT